jgi:hypothetical protein
MSGDNLISEELIENIFLSLSSNEDDKNINNLIKKTYDFFRENDYSSSEIQSAMEDYFYSRREYILHEYRLRFNNIRLIVDNIVNNISENNPENNSENNSENNPDENSEGNEENSEENNEQVNNQNPQIIFPSQNINNLNITFNNSILDNGVPLIFNIYNPPPPPVHIYEPLNNLTNILEIGQLLNELNNEAYIPSIQDLLGPQMLLNILLGGHQMQMNGPPMNDIKNVINTEVLNKLPVLEYKDLDKEKYKNCVICIEDFKDEDKVRTLKCEHGFHPECIDKWLLDCNYKCPVCRDDSNEHHSEI